MKNSTEYRSPKGLKKMTKNNAYILSAIILKFVVMGGALFFKKLISGGSFFL